MYIFYYIFSVSVHLIGLMYMMKSAITSLVISDDKVAVSDF